MYTAGSSSHFTISIFSPLSSSTIFCTRCPLGPTQAPTASTSSSRDTTAILERIPGSRATDFNSTVPSAISGTSNSNKRFNKPGCVREIMI